MRENMTDGPTKSESHGAVVDAALLSDTSPVAKKINRDSRSAKWSGERFRLPRTVTRQISTVEPSRAASSVRE